MDHERIGKYRIVGELGRGTMGEVYKAHDAVLKRDVALKTLAVHLGGGDETLERFQREAQAAALLNHPNIVTIHDFGQENGLLYMAMELLDGTDLREAIDTGALCTLEDKLDVMDGVLAALEYAHAKGVIHRDIKPANIRLAPGQVKIMDFGLARVSTSEMTQEGIVLGTPNYMSPEQALGDRVDGRSDLFSTGAVLYELLTGHKPFEAETTPSVLFQVVHKEPPPVRRWAPGTPAPLVAVVERALHKNRDKRFASATEMRNALATARRSAGAGASAAMAAPPVAPPKPPPLPAVRPGGPMSDGSQSLRMQGPPPLPPARVPTPRPAPSPLRSGADGSQGGAASRPRAEATDEMERVAEGSDTDRPPEPRVRRIRPGTLPVVAGAGVVLLLLVVIAAAVWVRARPRPQPQQTSSPSSPEVSALTRALATTQVQLAQRELDDKNYAAAAKQAQSALQLVSGHAEAERVLTQARARLKDLDDTVTTARGLADKGDTQAASEQLSRLLELDPRHPAAAELSARLNNAFQAEAEAAAASMRSARAGASDARAAQRPEFAAATEKVRIATDLAQRSEYADATRTFLEARDGFDRARRAALAQAAGESATPARGAEKPAASLAPPAHGSAGATPTPVLPVPTGAPATPAAAPAPARGFEAEATTIATPAASGGPAGFDNDGMSARRTPDFSGRVRFEVVPATVRPGDSFVVRIHLSNEGKHTLRVRSIFATTIEEGRRGPAALRAFDRELAAHTSGVLAEYSGVWRDLPSWALETIVTSERNETITARLHSR